MKPIENLYKELLRADEQNLIYSRIVQFPRIEIVFRRHTPFVAVSKIKEYVDKTYPIHRLQIGEYISPSHVRHLTLYMEVKQVYQGA
jgi:hypothetical protein